MGSFHIHDGTQTRFWIDTWLGTKPLCDQFSSLYNIVRRKHDTVVEVMRSTPLNISFRRPIVGDKLIAWQRLVSKLIHVDLTNEADKFRWGLHANSQFSVQSMYCRLIHQPSYPGARMLWKLKLPLKIKIFLWYLSKSVILTKDNVTKRNWNGNLKCSYRSSFL